MDKSKKSTKKTAKERAHDRHEAEEKRRLKLKVARMKAATRQIDGVERSVWCFLTLLYVVFVAILSGVTKVYLPETIFWGKVPLDPQYGVWILGIMLWMPFALMLQAYFKHTNMKKTLKKQVK